MKLKIPPFLRKIHTKLLLLLSIFFFLLLLLLLRPSPTPISDCNPKIPETLTRTIIHYATSNSTPQQTLAEISVSAQILRLRSPCNFLVFGLGLDSPMWAALNHAGRTVFFEENQIWISTIRAKFPSLETYYVKYDTKLTDSDALMKIGKESACSSMADFRVSGCGLGIKGIPGVFYEEDWDLIMVDGPTGWVPEAPGRMGAIYMAGMAARARRGEGETDVLVHDVDRKVEDEFSKEFLCSGFMVEEVGRIRHFRIPSFFKKKEMPFCPPPL